MFFLLMKVLRPQVDMDMDTNPAVIWIIDNNHWERANLRALLIERGYAVEGFVGIFHAVASLYREMVEKPALIVLEIGNLSYRLPEMDELARLKAPIVLLTGVFEEDCELLEKYIWAGVLRRPFTFGQVADTVYKLLKTKTAAISSAGRGRGKGSPIHPHSKLDTGT